MVIAVNFENSYEHGPALSSQYKLRHKCFVERQDYNVSSFASMEYDQYDNPSSVYLVYQDEQGEALGTSRLTPVTHRCMLKDLVPEMVDDHSIFDNPTVWEGTRFCVDKELNASLRNQIVKHLVLGYHEFGLANGVSKIIGMMPTVIWKGVLQRNGSHCEELGPIKIIDGQKIQAVSITINQSSLQSVMLKTGVTRGVLKSNDRERYKAAG